MDDTQFRSLVKDLRGVQIDQVLNISFDHELSDGEIERIINVMREYHQMYFDITKNTKQPIAICTFYSFERTG